MEHLYNNIEPYIWYAVALTLVLALRRHARLSERLGLALVVAIFGTSDFYEQDAWWTPWWLLVWKGTSLIVIAVWSWRIYRRNRDRADDRSDQVPLPK